MNLREFLENALGLLEKFGWTQGTYTSSDGSVCMVGSLYTVAEEIEKSDGPEEGNRLLSEAYEAITTVLSLEHYSLQRWNDRPTRTEEDVTEAFQRAIGLVDHREASS